MLFVKVSYFVGIWPFNGIVFLDTPYLHVGLRQRWDMGFKLYGQMCLFVYSIIQFIVTIFPSKLNFSYLQIKVGII